MTTCGNKNLLDAVKFELSPGSFSSCCFAEHIISMISCDLSINNYTAVSKNVGIYLQSAIPVFFAAHHPLTCIRGQRNQESTKPAKQL